MREIIEDVKINRFKLEEESETHPSIYYHYSELLVQAKDARDTSKAEYKKILASIELAYRVGKLELDCKVTEKAIESAVQVHPDVVAAQDRYLLAEKAVNSAQSAEESLRQKKGMLDNLIQLYVMQYYSNPTGNKYNKSESGATAVRGNLNRNKKEVL